MTPKDEFAGSAKISGDQQGFSTADFAGAGPIPHEHPYAAFLAKMQKPGRYLGGEEQSIIKSHEDKRCRFVLAFPDLYEIGMSHLGTRIIYNLLNKADDLLCERAFSPWKDMEEELRTRNLPLVSLETYRPLRDFDVVGVSLQYELSYSNVLLNLDLGGIPLRSVERGEEDPIVLAGGPTATHPEPLADFIDLFLVGEAEEVLPDLLRTIGDMKKAGHSRLEILGHIAKIPGCYVPRFYRVAMEERSEMEVVVGRTEDGIRFDVPEEIERVFVRDLDKFPFPTQFPVPYAEAIFDRASVEITRGCTEGCRFCQAGMIYRPVRERKPDDIIDAVLEGTDAAGFDETSLTALSTADVSCIDPLIKKLVPELAKRKVSLGIASLRAYGLNEDMLDEIKKVGIDGLTFAPEAGTQRMRDVINKNVSDEDILKSARRIFERGYERMKMYFIMGLPTETDEDLAGIIETGRNVMKVGKEVAPKRPPQITVSVSQHVPKPHTPFQWAAMDSMEDLQSKAQMIRDQAKRAKLGVKTHSVKESWLECLFARGDRRMGDVLESAYKRGARFDGWREYFSFDRWLDALEEVGIKPEVFTRTLPVGVPLPWSHISVGLEDGFLEGEYKKALKSRISPPCGKPAGAKVHHTNIDDAQAEKRRLVCYDCGVACDLGDMREERIVALRDLAKREEEVDSSEADETPPGSSLGIVPISRLKGRLAKSVLADDSAFKENAEAPYSKARIYFSKGGPLCFLSHLDMVRIIPRMFRRAGIEVGFSRGFNPQPRMSFGPALALGMPAEEEVLDCDLILERSAEDMSGFLSAEEREKIGVDLLERLRKVAPPGMEIIDLRMIAPGEKRLGEIVAGADYEVQLSTEEVDDVQQKVSAVLDQEQVLITRVRKKKKKGNKFKRGKSFGPMEEEIEIDIKPALEQVEVNGGRLEFRLRSDLEGCTPRPREVVGLLSKNGIDDIRIRRKRLLGRVAEGPLTSMRELGAVKR